MTCTPFILHVNYERNVTPFIMDVTCVNNGWDDLFLFFAGSVCPWSRSMQSILKTYPALIHLTSQFADG